MANEEKYDTITQLLDTYDTAVSMAQEGETEEAISAYLKNRGYNPDLEQFGKIASAVKVLNSKQQKSLREKIAPFEEALWGSIYGLGHGFTGLGDEGYIEGAPAKTAEIVGDLLSWFGATKGLKGTIGAMKAGRKLAKAAGKATKRIIDINLLPQKPITIQEAGKQARKLAITEQVDKVQNAKEALQETLSSPVTENTVKQIKEQSKILAKEKKRLSDIFSSHQAFESRKQKAGRVAAEWGGGLGISKASKGGQQILQGFFKTPEETPEEKKKKEEIEEKRKKSRHYFGWVK